MRRIASASVQGLGEGGGNGDAAGSEGGVWRAECSRGFDAVCVHFLSLCLSSLEELPDADKLPVRLPRSSRLP